MFTKKSTPTASYYGIYLMQGKEKSPVPFTGSNNEEECLACTGIGIKWGEISIAVALHDEADGKYITLTSKADKTRYKGYIDNCLDAVSDWDGQANTEHLKKVGLNSAIKPSDGWYIPALGQMLFIFLNRKAINQALKFVGGTPIDNWQWYWTSTEYSAKYAWHVNLSVGYVNYCTKATNTHRVRAVSAFIS